MPPEDETGHGTHVAGTIAGNGTDSGNVFTGVAPETNLVVARGLNSNDQWATIAGKLLPKG
ncbi:MAG: S8 family serine peptidase, partial [Halobacteria archaeon]|nr:S8 family serine peptidase [Halobacteria archaeon]